MNEYRIEVKVKNNLILKRIEQAGYKTIGEFCRKNNLRQGCLQNIVNLKAKPINQNGQFTKIITKISEILNCAPDDLFSDTQIHTELKTNKRAIEVGEAEMKFMLENQGQKEKMLEDVIHDEQLTNTIESALSRLSPREKDIIEMRLGLNTNVCLYTEIAKKYDITPSRVREIERIALRKLRHRSASNGLLEYAPEKVA
jgi:RNA polymerase sigma factor (sigma-70 family)